DMSKTHQSSHTKQSTDTSEHPTIEESRSETTWGTIKFCCFCFVCLLPWRKS
ncbi:hypothetical protein PV326_001327, partial [Microctonus aethiopoides]